MRHKYLIYRKIFMLLGAFACGSHQKSYAESIFQVVLDAVQNNPQVSEQKSNIEAAKEIVKQQYGGFLPSLQARASTGRERVRRDFHINTLNTTPSSGTVTLDRTDANLNLRQPLFEGLSTYNALKKAQTFQDQNMVKFIEVRESVAYAAAQVTIDLRRLSRLLKLADEQIAFHKRFLGLMNERFHGGAGTKVEVSQVESRLVDVEMLKLDILRDLEAKRAQFLEIVGRAPQNIDRIHFNEKDLGANAESIVTEAIAVNPTIQSAQYDVEIATRDIKISKSKMLPSLSFEVEGSRSLNAGGIPGSQMGTTALLVVTYNFFNGGTDLFKVQESHHRRAAKRASLASTRLKTESQVRISWSTAKISREKSKKLSALISVKRDVRDGYLEEFQIGKRSLIDILDANKDYLTTYSSLISSDAQGDTSIVTLFALRAQWTDFATKAPKTSLKNSPKNKRDLVKIT